MLAIISAVLFLGAAIGGGMIARGILKYREAPKPLAYIHGIAAVVAYLLLIVHAVQTPGDLFVMAVILFSFALVFGVIMFFRDMTGTIGPLPLVFLHAGVALAGFIVLLVAILGENS